MRNRLPVFILIAICSFFLLNCAGKAGDYQKLLDKIPQAELEDFQYTRGGVWTSATLQVTGGEKTDEYIRFEKVQINLNYWFERISIMISGYKRYFTDKEVR